MTANGQKEIFIILKLYVLILLAVFSLLSCGEPKMHEASMNFDLYNVRPFLKRIEERLIPSLPVDEFMEFTESIETNNEESIAINVDWDGSNVEIQYSVHMDDVDAPDVYFFSPSEELAKAISSEMITFAEELGI